ncbi:MAG: four helix bundle protein [Saprospiraceae bacterium]|nr:four helix bundle protein [Saprospiraceae bacterium]
MQQTTFNEQFRDRTKRMAIDTLQMYNNLKKSDTISVVGKQLIRSATSVAANFRATCRARSETEKYAKLCIVVEEADETIFWLEVLEESKIVSVDIKNLYAEAMEILKVMSSYKKTLGQALRKQ